MHMLSNAGEDFSFFIFYKKYFFSPSSPGCGDGAVILVFVRFCSEDSIENLFKDEVSFRRLVLSLLL
jgi:hypothetical protein